MNYFFILDESFIEKFPKNHVKQHLPVKAK